MSILSHCPMHHAHALLADRIDDLQLCRSRPDGCRTRLLQQRCSRAKCQVTQRTTRVGSCPSSFRRVDITWRVGALDESDTWTEEQGKAWRRKIAKAATLIKGANSLAPFDTANFNIALAIWKAIREIPEGCRTELLDRLGSKDIKRLWSTSAQRFAAHPQDIQNTLGPDFSLWDEFPQDSGQVTVFEGKAAVPAMSRFRKLFFLHPQTYELLGHVDVAKGLPGRLLYPLYFKAAVERAVVPGCFWRGHGAVHQPVNMQLSSAPQACSPVVCSSGTEELADMHLDYLPLGQLGLQRQHLPEDESLPVPGEPRWPFAGGLRAYMRPFGPGMLVGRGWKQPAGTSDPRKGSGFLYFVLARSARRQQERSNS